jgi:multicomponent Na+:H+ antiporter subunit C
VSVGLLMLGLYTAISHRNLLKKVVGLSIFQTAIILYFLLLSVKREGTLPIVGAAVVEARAYMNPLPHALMLTAIVVAVATTGLALAILLRLHLDYGTLEEDRVLERAQAAVAAGVEGGPGPAGPEGG